METPTITPPPMPRETKKGTISFFVKTLLIGVLCLMLMIPLLMVKELVDTRKHESQSVKEEITSRWGQQQNVTTPILVIPYTPNKKDAEETELYILPRRVEATAQLDVEMRYRSIYEIPVYVAHTSMKGAWHLADIKQAMAEVPGEYDLSGAKISIAISDPTGYKDLVFINVNGKLLRMKSDKSTDISTYIYVDNGESVYSDEYCDENGVFINSGVQSAKFPITIGEQDEVYSFDCTLDVAGSGAFGFIGTGVSSVLKSSGNWAAPSFQGKLLPISHNITETDYSAEWKAFHEDVYVEKELFSAIAMTDAYTSFINPADHYTQTERSIKYGILVIVLTILSVFAVELTLHHKRGGAINFLHYVLTGLSLVLFYSLLLSFSELIGFGWAYLIASVMTVVLNVLYYRSVLRNHRYALLLGGMMSTLYLGVYVLMQMKSYALLTGSLGLFIILAVVMFYSSKILKE